MTARPSSKVNATPIPTPELPNLAVDAKQLGTMLGLSVRTVRSMDAAGKLPRPVRLNGRSIRWVLDGPAGIRSWLQAGCPDRVTWEVLKQQTR